MAKLKVSKDKNWVDKDANFNKAKARRERINAAARLRRRKKAGDPSLKAKSAHTYDAAYGGGAGSGKTDTFRKEQERLMRKARVHGLNYGMGQNKLKSLFEVDNAFYDNLKGGTIRSLSGLFKELINGKLSDSLYAELMFGQDEEKFNKVVKKITNVHRLHLHLARASQIIESLNHQLKNVIGNYEQLQKSYTVQREMEQAYRRSSKEQAAVEIVKTVAQMIQATQDLVRRMGIEAPQQLYYGEQGQDRTQPANAVDEKERDPRGTGTY